MFYNLEKNKLLVSKLKVTSMQKIRPLIIVDLRLKTRILKLLIELVVEELNINKKSF